MSSSVRFGKNLRLVKLFQEKVVIEFGTPECSHVSGNYQSSVFDRFARHP